jgi:hypothetical protein
MIQSIIDTVTTNTDVTVVGVIVGAIVIVLLLGYLYLRNKSINDIREDVYKLFLQAEKSFTESGAGVKKMDWVVTSAYSLLPKYVQVFVSEDTLRVIIQKWFVAVKDLLDDGKINNSVTSTETEETTEE